MNTPGTLFLVPVPLGDPDDLSPRARRVLASVAVVAAEDTRVTAKLLRQVDVTATRLMSCHDHNEPRRAAQLVDQLLRGQDVALVSDAGTPLVSDPGYRVVGAAVEAGVRVVPLPGPCAAIAALSGSGLPSDRFVFLGFLPRDSGPRRAALRARRHERATLILYEAPHRLCVTLTDIADVLGDRSVCAARSLTKVWEDLIRGPASVVAAQLALEDPLKGEFTLVVAGDDGPVGAEHDAKVQALIEHLVAAEVPVGVVRDVVAEVFGRRRREVYQAALAAREP